MREGGSSEDAAATKEGIRWGRKEEGGFLSPLALSLKALKPSIHLFPPASRLVDLQSIAMAAGHPRIGIASLANSVLGMTDFSKSKTITVRG
jgi:hypothetical protein